MQPAGRGDDHGPVAEATYGVPQQRRLQPTPDVVEVRGPSPGRLPQREPGERDRLLRLCRRARDQVGDPARPGDQRVQHAVDVDELDERRVVQGGDQLRRPRSGSTVADVPRQVVCAPTDRALQPRRRRRAWCSRRRTLGPRLRRVVAGCRAAPRAPAPARRRRWVDGRLGQCRRAPPLAPLQQACGVPLFQCVPYTAT